VDVQTTNHFTLVLFRIIVFSYWMSVTGKLTE